MKNKDASLPYDDSSKESIYNYAMRLRGHSLREVADVGEIDDIRQNKGSFGGAVETFFFRIPPNSSSAPDFPKAGLELKTTPMRKGRNGSLVAKERLVIGMIDYMAVVDETFETSHLVEKAEEILLISYLYEQGVDALDYRVEHVELTGFARLTAADIAQIKADWEVVVDKVRAGRAHEISGSDTMYLEACTKAATASDRRAQPFSDEPAKPRAWALKASFVTALYNRFAGGVEAIGRSEDERSCTLLELVRIRFAPYIGLTEDELGRRFGYLHEGRSKPKNLCALVTRRILGVSDEARIEEFEKAGIKPKTIRVTASGMPKESMSFPAFDYFRLASTPFEESEFASYLEQKYLFVIYRIDDEGEYRLSEVAFWQVPESDVSEARCCYEEMQRRINEGKAENSVKSTENRVCHVRPHGRSNNDTLPTPQGDMLVKKGFWLNASYLKEQIAKACEAVVS